MAFPSALVSPVGTMNILGFQGFEAATPKQVHRALGQSKHEFSQTRDCDQLIKHQRSENTTERTLNLTLYLIHHHPSAPESVLLLFFRRMFPRRARTAIMAMTSIFRPHSLFDSAPLSAVSMNQCTFVEPFYEQTGPFHMRFAAMNRRLADDKRGASSRETQQIVTSR